MGRRTVTALLALLYAAAVDPAAAASTSSPPGQEPGASLQEHHGFPGDGGFERDVRGVDGEREIADEADRF